MKRLLLATALAIVLTIVLLPGVAGADAGEPKQNSPGIVITEYYPSTKSVTTYKGDVFNIVLSVTAEVDPPDPYNTLTYNWYKCDENGTIEGESLEEDDIYRLYPEYLEVGKYYFRCVITALYDCDPIQSNVFTVNIINPSEVDINFTTQPAALTQVRAGEITGTLTAAAEFNIEMQNYRPDLYWYECDKSGNVSPGAEPLWGEERGELTIPTDLTAGTYYYVCIARYHLIEPVSSNVATVEVTGEKPRIVSTDPIHIEAGKEFSYQLAAAGDSPITWKFTEGTSAPTWLQISGNGVLNGTPTSTTRTTHVLSVEAANSLGSDTAEITLYVYPKGGMPGIRPLKLPDGYLGVSYTQGLSLIKAEPANNYAVKWTFSDGTLPEGLLLDEQTGSISGTPTSKGTSRFTLIAQEVGEGGRTYTLETSITIGDTAPDPPNAIALPFGSMMFEVGKTYNLLAIIESAGTNSGVSPEVLAQILAGLRIRSSDPSVLNPTGVNIVFAGNKEGITTIYFEYNPLVQSKYPILFGDTLTCTVHFVEKGKAVDEVKLTPENGVVAPGGKLALNAEIIPSTAILKDIFWTSSDKRIATVGPGGVVTGVSPGTVRISASSTSGITAYTTVKVVSDIQEIILNKTSQTLGVGQEARLTAKILPEGAEDKEIVWSSDKPEVASVADGVVKGIAVGEAVIKAANPATGVEASCKVTVQQSPVAEFFELTVIGGSGSGQYQQGDKATITANAPGEGLRFGNWTCLTGNADIEDEMSLETTITMPAAHVSVQAFYESPGVSEIIVSPAVRTIDIGDEYPLVVQIKPSDAAIPEEITWISGDPAVATVDENGMVVGVSGGTAVITAKTGDFTSSCRITVRAPEDALVLKLMADVLAIQKNKTYHLGNLADMNGKWTVDDEKVATITANGVLKPKKTGDANLTFTVGVARQGAKFMGKSIAIGDEITIKLYVVKKGKAVNKLTLKPASIIIAPDETAKITPTVKPKSAKYKQVYWHSADKSVASVDENGRVTGEKPGKTIITAVSTSGLFKTIDVTVSGEIAQISFNKSKKTLGKGKTYQVNVKSYLPASLPAPALTWTSSKESVATVDQTGLVTTIKKGKATITATAPNGVKATCRITVQ